MSLKFALNERRTEYRAAVVVGKKVHKSAVVRNRIRRRIFEQLRMHAGDITGAYDLVITVHTENLATVPSPELAAEVTNLLQQAKIISAAHPHK
jgi:ribonuclease P protein component